MEWFGALFELWLGPWLWLSWAAPVVAGPEPKEADVIYPDPEPAVAVRGEVWWTPIMTIAELQQWARALDGLRGPPEVALPAPPPPEPRPKSADDIYGPD